MGRGLAARGGVAERARFKTRHAWLLAVAVAIAGCSGAPPKYEARVHVVQRGDTLYKIAFQHGLDQRDLARWNDLKNPDLIYVGQRLRLTGPARGAASTASGARSAAPSTRAPPAQSAAAPSRRSAPSAPAPPAPAPRMLPPPLWQWPTDGRVVSTFASGDGIGTGIAIGGRAGQSVRAAAEGRVVYAGSGLIGYGQLVIIRHNDTYLSAYGHNSRLLVTQGQEVRRGQEIAAMGLGPERQPRLHFEIRRNGVPVDPLPMLSARR